MTEGETQDNSAKESETPDSASGESETQESEKKKSIDQKSEKSEDTEKDQEPEVVGTLEKGGLCYILDDENQEWSYVESDDVRGFVQTKQLETGKKVKKEIEEKGEDTYALAKSKSKTGRQQSLLLHGNFRKRSFCIRTDPHLYVRICEAVLG